MTTPHDDATAPVDLPVPDPDTRPVAPVTPAGAAPPPPPTAPAPPALVSTDASAPPRSLPSRPASPSPGVLAPSSDAEARGRPRANAVPDNMPALIFGVLLVSVGGFLLLTRLTDLELGASAWPVWIVVPGLVLLLASFAIPPRAGLGLAIPGAIVTAVGLILWVQETYDAYGTWAYAWALVVPTAPGVAMLLYGAARGDRALARDGVRTTLIGLALFVGLALFFEGVVGISGTPIAAFEELLPFAAIGVGALLVASSVIDGRRRGPNPR